MKENLNAAYQAGFRNLKNPFKVGSLLHRQFVRGKNDRKSLFKKVILEVDLD